MDLKTRRGYRLQVLESIEHDLFGPAEGEYETIRDQIFNRYLAGMLFPSNLKTSDLNESDEPDANVETRENRNSVLSMTNESLPASMGISFRIKNASQINVLVEAGRYQKNKNEDNEDWERIPLASKEKPELVSIQVPEREEVKDWDTIIFDGLVKIHAYFRPRDDGHLVTITMINAQSTKKGKHSDEYAESTLFQCRFRVQVADGTIGEYPTISRLSFHEEDEQLNFVYRNRKTFGIGHGCAATWEPNSKDHVQELVANPIPRLEVKGLTNNISIPDDATQGLNLKWLSDPSRTQDDYRQKFTALLDAYKNWIIDQKQEASRLGPDQKPIAEKIVQRQENAVKRMEDGIECICSDENTENFNAFKLAQQAMFLQFLWKKQTSDGPFDLGKTTTKQINPSEMPTEEIPKWRPFQLAYQLLVIESIANDKSSERKTLDLLWFPTGGGKTEAYLALIAFEIIRRRNVMGELGYGTAVWMRYTLRLLTSQQFERSATLISVLEFMRKSENYPELGDEPITLGLWVGAETTPNSLDNDGERSPGARQLYERMLDDQNPQNYFQLTACPKCGTYIIPREKSETDHYGVEITPTTFKMFCPNQECDLHEHIPVSVIDEDLYNSPPTLLIGTIDKFARMVWVPASRVFLGFNDKRKDREKSNVNAPTLIVQDELHLINGPLGTIAGVYEASLDTAMRCNGTPNGPKYIAATATIQRAPEQVKSLYGREVFLFPPTGLNVEDSFFSKEEAGDPGRLYVGAINNGLYTPVTALIQASGACAQAAKRLDKGDKNSNQDELAVDSYWTQVVFHNSRQELGKTTTMLRDNVDAHLRVLETNAELRRKFDEVEELSANLKGAEIAKALENLGIQWPNNHAIDALPCTNMISVGVDVSRLGLMIIKGQPKSTAEYIQTSSRIGRDPNRPPGIVLTLYSASRPRDRSHFETFQSYHQALYRLVEPSTVTPFAPPALDRTLHAALVLTIRQVLGWSKSGSAGNFKKNDSQVSKIIDKLKLRLEEACLEDHSDERIETSSRLDKLVDIWHDMAVKNSKLRFDKMPQFEYLLCYHHELPDKDRPPWPTLNSMRYVDGNTGIAIRGGVES